ncbi:MAG: DUF262 domain-containing protein [Verrucomicrobiota bacterium]|jgi:hypothetical protein
MPTILEQYRVSDFLEWNKDGKLILNPKFQRGSVWPSAARSYLIDTILRELPIPKIYFRTTVDVLTKQSVREVVDGQQRLRAIIEFAGDKFELSKVTKEFAGRKYSTLDSELQAKFLSYAIGVGQLINASDKDVFEVFARLNSYNVQLNGPEKRHAKYQGDFKWAVHEMTSKWSILWDKYQIVSVRERVRMLADSLMAEMFGVFLEGITDGGQPNIAKLYDKYDKEGAFDSTIIAKIEDILDFFTKNLADDLKDTPICNAPHFLMLFSAIAHERYGIPLGQLNELPARDPTALQKLELSRNNLTQLAAVIGSDSQVAGFEEFWLASSSSTQRIASRKKRFPVFVRALGSTPI